MACSFLEVVAVSLHGDFQVIGFTTLSFQSVSTGRPFGLAWAGLAATLPRRGRVGLPKASPGWGDGEAVRDSDAAYAEALSRPLTRADLPLQGEVVHKAQGLKSYIGKGVLQAAAQHLKSPKGLFDRRMDWGPDLDPFRQKIDRVRLRIVQMIALHNIRPGLSMRRVYLETVALEIICQNSLKSCI